MSGLDVHFAFGEAVGWRAWTVVGPPDNPRLFSQFTRFHGENGKAFSKKSLWPRGRWMVAHCPKEPSDPYELLAFQAEHRTPNPDCSCGMYAARTREHLLDLTAQGIAYQAYTKDRLAVIGKVAFAGRVIEHANGFKGEKARPLELYVPAGRWKYASGLENVYGVPVILDNTWAQVVSDHGTRIGQGGH